MVDVQSRSRGEGKVVGKAKFLEQSRIAGRRSRTEDTIPVTPIVLASTLVISMIIVVSITTTIIVIIIIVVIVIVLLLLVLLYFIIG